MLREMRRVKKAIQDVRTEESHRKKKKIFEAVAIVVIAILAVYSYLYVNESFDFEKTSYGYPDKISYELLSHESPYVTVIRQETFPAICSSTGSIRCVEPVAEKIYFQEKRYLTYKYEHAFYFRVENNEDTQVEIVSLKLFSATDFCYRYDIEGKEIVIGSDGASDRIVFICVDPTDAGSLKAGIEITYSSNGQTKTASFDIKTVYD